MDSIQKIGKLEAIAIIIMIMINQIILNLPNTILMNTGSSSWLNVIYISIIAIIFCLLICKLFKPFPTSDIIDISEFLCGKFFKCIISIIYIIFLLFVSSILLRYFANSLKIIYFEKTPLIFLLLLFLTPVAIAGRLGIKPLAQVNLMFIPVLLISILLLFFTNLKNSVPQRIFPILGFGLNKTFFVGINNIFAFSGFAYIYFLMPILKRPEQFKSISIISIVISALYLLICIVSLTMIFPFISFSDEMFSVYLLTRMIKLGKFFQRIDAIFIFIWILSALSFLALSTHLLTHLFKKLTGIKNYKTMVSPFIALIFGCSLVLTDIAKIKFVQNYVLKYVVISLIFIITPIILILANLKLKRSKRNET